MKKAMVIVGAVILSVALLSAPHTTVGVRDEGQGFKSFQLVYHSDTRGYHRPCG